MKNKFMLRGLRANRDIRPLIELFIENESPIRRKREMLKLLDESKKYLEQQSQDYPEVGIVVEKQFTQQPLWKTKQQNKRFDNRKK